jgi:hypothetical protein
MDVLVGATQHIGIRNLAEFSDFYRKFCTIVEYLSSQKRIGNREISTNFLCALPADLQHKIMFCIQVSDPNRHVDDPHTLKSLFDAGVHILKGNTILDTMNPYAVTTAYVQLPNPAVQQPQVVQQSLVNYPQNMYIPGTSISLPYGYYQPLATLAPFPYHQPTVHTAKHISTASIHTGPQTRGHYDHSYDCRFGICEATHAAVPAAAQRKHSSKQWPKPRRLHLRLLQTSRPQNT